MRPIVVIELDVFLYRCAELILCLVEIAAKILLFDGGEKGFCNGVVMG